MTNRWIALAISRPVRSAQTATASSVDALFQEIALNFYPERADFTGRRSDGEEFASHLFSKIARRELGDTS